MLVSLTDPEAAIVEHLLQDEFSRLHYWITSDQDQNKFRLAKMQAIHPILCNLKKARAAQRLLGGALEEKEQGDE